MGLVGSFSLAFVTAALFLGGEFRHQGLLEPHLLPRKPYIAWAGQVTKGPLSLQISAQALRSLGDGLLWVPLLSEARLVPFSLLPWIWTACPTESPTI